MTALLLLAVGAAGAQGRSPSNLQVQALGQGLTAPVQLRAASGGREAECVLTDDGSQPADMHAGDGVWSCDLVLPGDAPWTLRMSWGGRVAVGVLTTAAENQPVFLSTRDGRIEARTDIVFVPMDAGGAPSPAGVAGMGPSVDTTATDATPTTEAGGVLEAMWGPWVAFGALGVALALPLLVAPRVPKADPRPPGTAPAARLSPEALGERLAELNGTHRVLALGPARLPAVSVEEALNAAELVALADRLADGRIPVAIVVTDPSLLEPDRGDAWEELVAAARGRHAVYGAALARAGVAQATPPSNGVPAPSTRVKQST